MASTTLNFLYYLRIPIAATSAIAASLSGLLYWKQNEVIYPRNFPAEARTTVPDPSQFPNLDMDDWEELMLDTPDGEKLHAYLIRASNRSQTKPVTVLMFHGNAGNIGHRVPIAGVLENHMSVNVFMVEYRGYGKSTGNPDEKGLNIDAQTALDFMRRRPDISNTKFVLYGQSLGGAVSINLVAKNQDRGDIKALILENTFLSIRALIPSVMPAARYLAPLCHQLWPSEDIISKIYVPTLFLSGLKDEIVPASHMKRLYDICTAPKVWKAFANGTHNESVASPGYFEAVADFLQNYVLK